MNLEQELQQWGTRAEGASPTISLEEITARAAEPDGDVVLLSPVRLRRVRPRLFAAVVLGAAAALAVGVLVIARNRDDVAPVATEPRPPVTTVPATSSTIEPRAAGFDPRWLPTDLPEGWSLGSAFRSSVGPDDGIDTYELWTLPDGRSALYAEGSEMSTALPALGDLTDRVERNGTTLLVGGWPNGGSSWVRTLPDNDGRQRGVLSPGLTEDELRVLFDGTSTPAVPGATRSLPLAGEISTVTVIGPGSQVVKLQVLPPGPLSDAMADFIIEATGAHQAIAAARRSTPEATFLLRSDVEVEVTDSMIDSMAPADLSVWDALEQAVGPGVGPRSETSTSSTVPVTVEVPTSGTSTLTASYDPVAGLIVHDTSFGDERVAPVILLPNDRDAYATDPFVARTIVAALRAGTVRVEGELGDGSVVGGGTDSVVAVPGTDQLIGVLDGPIGEPVRAVIGYDTAGNVTQRYGRPPFESTTGG